MGFDDIKVIVTDDLKVEITHKDKKLILSKEEVDYLYNELTEIKNVQYFIKDI